MKFAPLCYVYYYNGDDTIAFYKVKSQYDLETLMDGPWTRWFLEDTLL